MSNSCGQMSAFIGDDLTIRIISRDSLVDLAPYTITSQLRANGGDGVVVATFSVTKDTPDVDGKVFAFTAGLDRTITSTLLKRTNYGIDYKFGLNGAIQHSTRIVIRFEGAITQ